MSIICVLADRTTAHVLGDRITLPFFFQKNELVSYPIQLLLRESDIYHHKMILPILNSRLKKNLSLHGVKI